MKTLVRPQAKTTIAIYSDQKYKKNLQADKLSFRSAKTLFTCRGIILFLSVLIFIFVHDSPELQSDLCNKYNSQQACNVW